MVTTSPDLVVADAVLALLRSTGRRVYDGQYDGPQPAPANVYPFGVFYPIAGGLYDGPPLAAPHQRVLLGYQVTVTGLRRDQTQSLACELQDHAWGRNPGGAYASPLVVTGFVVLERAPMESSPGATLVGDPPTRVWNVPLRFTVTVTPTTS